VTVGRWEPPAAEAGGVGVYKRQWAGWRCGGRCI